MTSQKYTPSRDTPVGGFKNRDFSLVDKYVMTFPQNVNVMDFYHNVYKPYKDASWVRHQFHSVFRAVHITPVMSSERFSVALDNGRYVKVSTWNGEPRLDLRE